MPAASPRRSRTACTAAVAPAPGETFWQFRQYQASDTRASHRLAALGQLRPSLSFASASGRRRTPCGCGPTFRHRCTSSSHLAPTTQARPRTGLTAGRRRAAGARRRARRADGADAADGQPQSCDPHRRNACRQHRRARSLNDSLPPKARLSRFSGALLFSDFLDPLDDIRAAGRTACRRRRQPATSMQVLDPAEETLPYQGRTEFLGLEGGERWVADRVETLRPQYQAQLEAHRAGPERYRQAPRLVVPGASYRPAGSRAAARAHHAHCRASRRRPSLACAARGDGCRDQGRHIR